MNQREESKESMPERNSATSNRPNQSEKPLEHKDLNGLDNSESNLGVKASMAQQLDSMGLKVEAICRILRTDANKVAEWIRLHLEREDVND